MVYAKFQYSLNSLFCEQTEICEYMRKLYMYRVPQFRTMLTFTNYGLLKRSADLAYSVRIPPASEFVMRAEFHYRFNNSIFFLTFLEPLIHDSKFGNKR